MSQPATVAARFHPMVVASLARLAEQGGWARVLEGKPLEDPDDRRDADLLEAADVLRGHGDDTYEVLETHPWFYDAAALAPGMRALLRRALRHAEGSATGWDSTDLHLVADQGRASVAAAQTVAESLLPLMPSAHRAFLEGRGRLLDVGTGSGAFSRVFCTTFPGCHATGIDVLPEVVDLARSALRPAGLSDVVDLRVQSVTTLCEEGIYDLAWVPQAFVPRADLLVGLRRIRDALRPDGWLVCVLSAHPAHETDVLRRALAAHDAHLSGGGQIAVEDVLPHVHEAGFTDVSTHDQADQVVLLARRPPATTSHGSEDGPSTTGHGTGEDL